MFISNNSLEQTIFAVFKLEKIIFNFVPKTV